MFGLQVSRVGAGLRIRRIPDATRLGYRLQSQFEICSFLVGRRKSVFDAVDGSADHWPKAITDVEFEWNMEYGIRNMEYGIWNMEYGIWNGVERGVDGVWLHVESKQRAVSESESYGKG